MSSEFVRATEEERRAKITAIDSIPRAVLRPGVDTAIVPTDKVTLSFMKLVPGLNAKLHSHPEEQVCVMLEGEMDVALDGKLYRVRAGDVAVIPGGVPHSGVTLGEGCRVLDIFSPPRKDFEEKLRQAIAEQK